MLAKIAWPDHISTRSVKPEDQLFCEELFKSTRDYFYLMPIPRFQVDVLLKQQFFLQQTSYAENFPRAENLIVEYKGESIGKIILNLSTQELHIIDIVMAQKIRNQGFGTGILCAMQFYAASTNRRLKLAVDQQNTRAKKLYTHLGFNVTESSETHHTLVWLPAYT